MIDISAIVDKVMPLTKPNVNRSDKSSLDATFIMRTIMVTTMSLDDFNVFKAKKMAARCYQRCCLFARLRYICSNDHLPSDQEMRINVSIRKRTDQPVGAFRLRLRDDIRAGTGDDDVFSTCLEHLLAYSIKSDKHETRNTTGWLCLWYTHFWVFVPSVAT